MEVASKMAPPTETPVANGGGDSAADEAVAGEAGTGGGSNGVEAPYQGKVSL